MAKILVVEDDDSVRAMTVRALQNIGHAIEEAADGAEGLERIHACSAAFDLVVSDIRMPEMDGIAMAKEAARAYPGLKIMLVTGYADQRERADDLDGIIQDVLLKPFALADFRSAVSRLLAA